MFSRVAAIAAVFMALSMVATSASYAEGGTSIAAAPTAVWGQQEFGNTANGYKDGEGVYYSWWNLPVTVGDAVSLEWEAPDYSNGEYPEIHVYPVGTTDFNVRNVSESEYNLQGLNPNGRNEKELTASKTGPMPLAFISEGGCCGGRVGPYDFVALVEHASVVRLPRVRLLKHRQLVSVHVHNPEGGQISDTHLVAFLEAKGAGGSWKTLGRSSVAKSVAAIRAKVPSRLWHQQVSLRATVRGAFYMTTHSRPAPTTIR